MGQDSRSERSDHSHTRRSLIGAAVAAGVAGLAGCSGLTDQTHTASSVTVDQGVLEETGFERIGEETITRSASESVGPLDGEVTANSKLAVYSDGESAPLPSESERWAESDTPLAAWAGNDPVRGLPASAAVDGDQLAPDDGSIPIESVPASAATVLYPDAGTDGAVSLAESLVVARADDVDWGGRESDGTVTLDDTVSVAREGEFLPDGATLPPDST